MVDFKLLLNPLLLDRSNNLLRQRFVKDNVNFVLMPQSVGGFPASQNSFYCSDESDDDEDEEDRNRFCATNTSLIYVEPSFKRRYVLIGALIVFIIVVLLTAYFTGLLSKQPDTEEELIPPNPTKPLPPSKSALRVFKRAAVCADGIPCAEVGKNILEKNGSAADAAIATLFCNGMFTMQSMGLGGGFLMTIYKKDEKKAYFLNAREKAPKSATNEMYKSEKTSQMGPLAIAVPGELRGYWALYQKFGRLPWKDLVQPTIDICEQGYNMSDHQYLSLFKMAGQDPNIDDWFKDSEGKFKKPGSLIVPTKLCNTLKLIAENGGDDLYNGTLSKMWIEDLKSVGSIITEEDLDEYEAQWMDPIAVEFSNGDQLYSAPPPGSGALLGFIMNILDGYNFNRTCTDDENIVLTYHRITEAFKYAYAKRTELGDTSFVDIKNLLANLTSREYAQHIREKIMDNMTFTDPGHYGAVFYNKDDHGTAHMSILAEDGDAISVTSSVNLYFGAGITSKQTGIIFNSVMDDFSFKQFQNYFGLPGSPNNAMLPGKRPLSSMSPSIIVDKNSDVKMVVGASGGTKITTTVAWTIMRSLWFGDNIKEAVDTPRIHHQLFPMVTEYEYGTLQRVVEGLKQLGHILKRNSGAGSNICALLRNGPKITANADFRKQGDVYGLT